MVGGEASWGSMLGRPNALERLEQSPETILEEPAGIQSLEQKPNPDVFLQHVPYSGGRAC